MFPYGNILVHIKLFNDILNTVAIDVDLND